MKKTILITLTTVFVLVFLFPGLGFGYDDYRYGDYDDYDYADFEYRFSSTVDHLERYHGPVYYYRHPQGRVYFVLTGHTTYVVPAYVFKRYVRRSHFVLVPRTRFIRLSCGGLDYYDNYLRFNFYFDSYNRSHWDRRHNNSLRLKFRKYYNGRHQQKWYYKNRRRIMKQRGLDRYEYDARKRRKTEKYHRYNRHNRRDERSRRYNNYKSYKNEYRR